MFFFEVIIKITRYYYAIIITKFFDTVCEIFTIKKIVMTKVKIFLYSSIERYSMPVVLLLHNLNAEIN